MNQARLSARIRHVAAAAILTMVAALSGCAPLAPKIDWSTPLAPLPQDLVTQVSGHTLRDIAVRKGMAALVSGDYPAASRQFNLALKLEPRNSTLNFLNGMTYQLMLARGDEQKAPLAEKAYLLALQFDPQNALAAYQLGRLYLDKHDYARAERYLAQAVLGHHDDAGSWQALAVASYYNRDLKLAMWAADQAKQSGPDHPATLRAAVLIETVAGDDKAAAQDMRNYAATDTSGWRLAALQTRVSQLRGERGAPSPPDSEAQAWLSGAANAKPPSTAPEKPADTATAEAAGAMASGGSVPSWFDCGGSSTEATVPAYAAASAADSYSPSSYGETGNTPQSGDTEPLPALPSPCQGAKPPRMALIDAVLISSEASESSSYGINLLDGLQVVLNGSISRGVMSDLGTVAGRASAWSLALGNTTATGIAYALNIANAENATNQVIARPTLVALDRKPSQFFSGSDLSIALPGQYGGSVEDKPIGLSLSVTPTFIDDDTLLLTVKISRSFFENLVTASGTIDQSIETSRSMAQANVVLKFGQTLILSGLSEMHNQTDADGVPVLRAIPGLQYLFSNKQTSKDSKTVLVLLTPRRPAYGDQLPPPVDPLAQSPGLDALRERASKGRPPNANLDIIARALDRNPHYLAYRSGDVNAEPWIESKSLTRTLHEALNLLYF